MAVDNVRPHTPELDKMSKAISEHDTQVVGDFLDWLLNRGGVFGGYVICEWNGNDFDEVHHTVEQWLALRHDIDLDKINAERDEVLRFVRLQNLASSLEPK